MTDQELAARLQHPHILTVLDSGELADGRLWFTMLLRLRRYPAARATANSPGDRILRGSLALALALAGRRAEAMRSRLQVPRDPARNARSHSRTPACRPPFTRSR